jgi:tetratricopeptide (TPR) repeat protein
MLCQVCGTANHDEQEFCSKCQQKLLVLSGGPTGSEEEGEHFDPDIDEETFSFDEHLLERISILEEAVKRTAETARHLLAALHKQERNILINQTGLATIRELLEDHRLIRREEWSEIWQSKVNYQMLALEKRERFLIIRDKISALYQGRKRKLFDDLLEDAEYALFAFDIDSALRTLEAAHRLDPENYELNFFLGESYFNEGQTDLALAFFQRALAVMPDHYEGLVFSGVIQHERGNADAARDLLQRAVALYPDAFLPQFSLGAVYAGQGQLARAVMMLEKAVEIDPVPQALFLLGSSLYEMGKITAAIGHLQQVVRLDPAYEEAYHLLGLAYLDRHWNRKALDAFRQAQRLNPKKLRYQDLVRFLSGTSSSPLPGISDDARRWAEEAEKAMAGSHPNRALEHYRRAIDREPDNPTLLISYALLCLQLNRSQETERATRRLLDLEPEEMLKATAYATLIEALRAEGRYKEGNRIGYQLLEEGDSDFSRTIAYYEMAYNLAELEEDLDQALEYAQRSLDLAPEELRQFPLAALGWVHYKREEFDRAIEFLEKSSRIGSSATTLTHLGMALLASGAEQRARDVLAEARVFEGEGISVEQRMMECLQASNRIHERVYQGRGRKPSA